MVPFLSFIQNMKRTRYTLVHWLVD